MKTIMDGDRVALIVDIKQCYWIAGKKFWTIIPSGSRGVVVAQSKYWARPDISFDGNENLAYPSREEFRHLSPLELLAECADG